MTLADVERRVALIKGCVGDDERAHSMEDGLYTDLLRAIADGRCDDAVACAEAALATQSFDFARWCA